MPNDITKPNIILDLDQTLISAEASEDFEFKKYKEKSKKFKYHDMDGYYIIYNRPYLQSFLNYIFEHFNVSIWTAASKDYALFIIENIILNNENNRKLDFIFFNYHCKISNKNTRYTKKLTMLWDVFKLPGFTEKNTVIIDDYKEDVYKCQPNNCIIAKPFEFKEENSENDNFLKEVIPQLKKMLIRINENDNDIATTLNNNMEN